MSDENRKELFFPYYVNQGRLLDIYAILNGGYSEYEELTEETAKTANKNAKGTVNISTGFKLFKISSDVSGEYQNKNSNSNSATVKKVQTITSILSIVLDELKNKSYLKDIADCKTGSFIALPVNLQINSVKNMIDELTEVMKLISDIGKLGISTGVKNSDLKNYENIAKSLKSFVNSEEIIYECADFAITGNIMDMHYYQGSKSDIINTDIMCLAQVKKVFPNGTELMKDNKMGIFKDASIKNNLIDMIKGINENDAIEFSSIAVTGVYDKPVYQIEIIALYQSELNEVFSNDL